MDKNNLKKIINWTITNEVICIFVYLGVVKGNVNAQYVTKFIIIVFFIASLLSLSKSGRKSLQEKGRSVPAWVNAIVEYTVILTLVWFGWFWFAGLKLVEHICFSAAYNKEGWDD